MKKSLLLLVLTSGLLALATSAAPAKKWVAGKYYPIDSSRFAWAYYEDITQTLILGNPHGGAQEYFGVPPKLFEQFMDARIKGAVFAGKIEQHFPVKKVWIKQPTP